MPIITDTTQIQIAQLMALRHALQLEAAGVRRRGRSATAIARKTHKLSGNRQSMVDQINARIESLLNRLADSKTE